MLYIQQVYCLFANVAVCNYTKSSLFELSLVTRRHETHRKYRCRNNLVTALCSRAPDAFAVESPAGTSPLYFNSNHKLTTTNVYEVATSESRKFKEMSKSALDFLQLSPILLIALQVGAYTYHTVHDPCRSLGHQNCSPE